MSQAFTTMLGVGIALILAGAFVFTRRAANEGAVYARRIAGTMLSVFGAVLILFAVMLTMAGAR